MCSTDAEFPEVCDLVPGTQRKARSTHRPDPAPAWLGSEGPKRMKVPSQPHCPTGGSPRPDRGDRLHRGWNEAQRRLEGSSVRTKQAGPRPPARGSCGSPAERGDPHSDSLPATPTPPPLCAEATACDPISTQNVHQDTRLQNCPGAGLSVPVPRGSSPGEVSALGSLPWRLSPSHSG